MLEKLLGKDYEVITADERLDKIAADFVEHCATRWESGKAMLVCIDKITCARMHQADRAALEGEGRGRARGGRRPSGADRRHADDEAARRCCMRKRDRLLARRLDG